MNRVLGGVLLLNPSASLFDLSGQHKSAGNDMDTCGIPFDSTANS